MWPLMQIKGSPGGPLMHGRRIRILIATSRAGVAMGDMTSNSIIHRYLDPGETLAEVLFGLIMMLTFTVGARLLTKRSELDAQEVVIAAIGCNIAWGVIDAVLFVL